MPVLTRGDLLVRLRKTDLIVTPMLDPEKQIGEGSINIRLGTKFIDTKVREYAELDPPSLSLARIKELQETIQVAFGGRYVLHPRRLVLGVTFEFIALPLDLSGFVLSRSRYGRAGLMVATATYIQPGWKGCLTLELFNYGDFPMTLRAGSQVAQLVLQTADPPLSPELVPKRPVPIGPQFTRMDMDPDWPKLAAYKRRLLGESQAEEPAGPST